jgi:hypothetical protein
MADRRLFLAVAGLAPFFESAKTCTIHFKDVLNRDGDRPYVA